MWDIYSSLYKCLSDSKNFNVTIILLHTTRPGHFESLKLDPSHKLFFENRNIPYVVAFNNKTNQWMDLKTLNPDFLVYIIDSCLLEFSLPVIM
jgi:hypothetical protein